MAIGEQVVQTMGPFAVTNGKSRINPRQSSCSLVQGSEAAALAPLEPSHGIPCSRHPAGRSRGSLPPQQSRGRRLELMSPTMASEAADPTPQMGWDPRATVSPAERRGLTLTNKNRCERFLWAEARKRVVFQATM